MAGFFDDETLQNDLDKFHSSFELELTDLSKDRVKSMIKKLSTDQKNTTKPKIEDIQISNFLSYLYFLLEDFDHANQYVDESLQKDPDNIIANANKARFLSEAGGISDAEDIVTKLKELEKRDYCKRKCYAEADLAYAFSRSGPCYHQKAVDIYNRVLMEYPTQYAWKFGLGLTLLRQTHCFLSQSEDRFSSEQKERKTVQVAEMLLTVATKSDDPRLCAKAYARLGKAMYNIEKSMFTNVTQTVKAIDSKTCFEKAFEICQDEPSVLEICGQHARYRMELETSEKILRKSLQIKPTCHAYHHLALTLQRKVECGLDREQSVNSAEEHLGKGNGQKQRDEQLRRGDNWRHYQAKGKNTKYFQSKQNKGQCKRYQYNPRYYPDHNDPSQRMINPGYQYRNQLEGYPDHSDPSQMFHLGYQYRNQPEGYPDHSDPSQMFHLGYQYRNQPEGYPRHSGPSQMYQPEGYPDHSGPSQMYHSGYHYRNQPEGYHVQSGPSQMHLSGHHYRNQPEGYPRQSGPSQMYHLGYHYRNQPEGYHVQSGPSQMHHLGYHYRRQQMGNRFHTPWDCYGHHGYNGNWYDYQNGNGINNDDLSCYGNANDAFDNYWDTNGNIRWTGDRRSVKQKKRRTSRCLTADQPQRQKEQNLRRAIKSPLKVQTYSGNKSLIEAVALLEKTEELDQYALGIQYDKGIIYRKLGQIEKAVEVFKLIVSKRKYLPTKTLLTNVYEQLGLCLLELSQSEEVSSDIQQKHKKDGECHLSRAVQLQSEIVANDPQFKAAWNSYPTLKELLSDQRDGKPKQLAVLHMLMGDHKDSISIYQELVLKEEAELNPEDYINMLKCYMKDGEHEKCVTLLSSLECTTTFSGLPQSLIFDVYIDCAFHAYTTDNAQLAYQHFRSAFKVYGLFDKTNEDRTNTDEDDDTKDILILHSCAQKWKCKLPRNLGTILEDCTGLQYTINEEYVLGGKLVLKSMASVIHKIPCIIIMTHDSAEEFDKRTMYYVNLAITASSEESGPQVIVASDDKCNMPDIAKTKPFIVLPPPIEGAMIPNDKISEDHKKWVKDFITVLKPK